MTRLRVLNDQPHGHGAAPNGSARDGSAPDGDGTRAGVDLAALRERFGDALDGEQWRSLEQLAGTPEFEAFLTREFPENATEWKGGEVSRRRFLQVMGAAAALGGTAACTSQPPEKIVPYVDMPEGVVPGKALYFASTHTVAGYGRGVLVESHMGRPTKVEGNPSHPASLGATDVFAQASVLDLYDPERLQTVRHLDRVSTWSDFTAGLAAELGAQEGLGGQGLRLLTGAVSSPTLVAQIQRVLARFPQARWHVWEPAAAHGAREGLRRAAGGDREAVYDLSQADVVLTLDSDFLVTGPGALAYARQFTARRRTWHGAEAMTRPGEGGVPAETGLQAPHAPESAGADVLPGAPGAPAGHRAESAHLPPLRLYSVESTPTSTSTLADHRLALAPSEVLRFARALAAELGVAGGRRARRFSRPKTARWVQAVAADLRRAGAGALVVPGEYAPAELHALAHAINRSLGAVGRTVRFSDPVVAGPADMLASLRELTADMATGRVDTLFILGGNPVFTAPADLDFTAALERVPRRIYLTMQEDETAAYCHWVIPETHYLESWSDARAYDGTPSLVQPLIVPLFEGAKSIHQMVAVLEGVLDADPYELVREHWRESGLAGAGAGGFEAAWRKALHDGVLPAVGGATGAVTQPATPQAGAPQPGAPQAGPTPPAGTASTVAAVMGVNERAELAVEEAPTGPDAAPSDLDILEEDLLAEEGEQAAAGAGSTIELNFRPDPCIFDGRWANNSWLQELPKPITKLTWDNALLVGTRVAQAFGLKASDLVELEWQDRRLVVPVWVVPAHGDGSATLYLGYGRRRVGPVGADTGFDAYRLRTSGALWTAPAVRLRKVPGFYPLACTQDHHSMQGRHLVRTATYAELERHPEVVHEMGHQPAEEMTMYPGYEYEGYAWGMAIDLNACTGCNACVVACQSENNIPTVGKDQVLQAREMHWLRIDRYYEGSLDEPRLHNQPLPCMHCETAPCEVVCPVAATVHSDEGLNDMVYNRCVGTRYCSNNCPYKVRRFNFFRYADMEADLLKMVRNPDVTVRSRGVMEKCTYCVQRINQHRIEAKRQGRAIRDGEVMTACQQACPSDAIVFGDTNDADARVSRWKAQHLDYGLLAELNTRPRTTYLAKLSNPNPELES